MDYDLVLKLAVIGSDGVGKTSLLEKYVDNTFRSNYMPTIGVDFKIKTLELDNKIVKLQLWDHAGQQRFRGIGQSYFRGIQGAIVVFDGSDPNSFQELQAIHKEYFENRNDVPAILLANKSDLFTGNEEFQNEKDFAKKHSRSNSTLICFRF
jgi:Ras-related protein Rab-1A